MDSEETFTPQIEKNIFKPKPNNRLTLGTINCNELNLRSEPSSYGDILRVLRKDEAVVINGESGNYYKVSVDNLSGYCVKEFITIK